MGAEPKDTTCDCRGDCGDCSCTRCLCCVLCKEKCPYHKGHEGARDVCYIISHWTNDRHVSIFSSNCSSFLPNFYGSLLWQLCLNLEYWSLVNSLEKFCSVVECRINVSCTWHQRSWDSEGHIQWCLQLKGLDKASKVQRKRLSSCHIMTPSFCYNCKYQINVDWFQPTGHRRDNSIGVVC